MSLLGKTLSLRKVSGIGGNEGTGEFEGQVRPLFLILLRPGVRVLCFGFR